MRAHTENTVQLFEQMEINEEKKKNISLFAMCDAFSFILDHIIIRFFSDIFNAKLINALCCCCCCSLSCFFCCVIYSFEVREGSKIGSKIDAYSTHLNRAFEAANSA